MSVKELTHEAALSLCRLLWIWMAEGGKSSYVHKLEWPEWKNVHWEYGPGKDDYGWDCPACEYDTRNANDCRQCILLACWDGHCTGGDSPFKPFHNGRGTPADAMKIVRGCEVELVKLGVEVEPHILGSKS